MDVSVVVNYVVKSDFIFADKLLRTESSTEVIKTSFWGKVKKIK